MAISFEESLKKSATSNNSNKSENMVAPTSEITTADMPEMQMIAAYSGETETWTLSEKYRYYPDFHDDAYSKVDNLKNIVLDPTQINITQETNSQFVPFEMNRYYDGYDLMKASLLIHFVNANNNEDNSVPINVYYSDSKIRFGWLVNNYATAAKGTLKFEIQAIGVTSWGNDYVWKTRPSAALNVLESLSGSGIIEPDESWITSFMALITEKVVEAQDAAQKAETQAELAQSLANEAKAAADVASETVETAKAELREDVTLAVKEEVEEALLGYSTREETSETIDNKIDAALVPYSTTEQVSDTIDTKVTDVLKVYYTAEQIDTLFENFDISDQLDDVKKQIENLDGLANFDVTYDGTTMTFWNGEIEMKKIAINSDPSAEWTTAYTKIVDDKISAAQADSSQVLESYKVIVDADLVSIHNAIDGLPETLQEDYYNKMATDEKFATKTELSSVGQKIDSVESTANTNKADINTLSEKVIELQAGVDGIDKSPRLSYEATYDEEQVYTLWEIEGEGDTEVRTPKGQFKIVGGGGSATSSVLKIEYVTKTPYVATKDATVELSYIFSGVDSGGVEVQEGTATWKVGGTTVATEIIAAGENKFDVTKYLNVGTQKVMLSITDDNGSLATRSWTVQVVDVRLESTFDDKLTHSPGNVAFSYTPYGAIEKTVHFEVNGEEIGTVVTSASGIPLDYTITGLTHGSHLLRVYMTAQISSNDITSNEILKDILILDENETTPIIGCTLQEFTAKQYDTTNIQYTVYDPKTESPTVTLAVDGDVVKESKLTSSTDTWAFKSSDLGEHILTITCGETVKTLKANIVELGINITPVTAGLAFDFNPTGYSNTDTDRLWSDGEVEMTVSENFDWINGGYQMDENGDQYFCVKAGTTANINYELFADDAKKNGKEFKLVFRTTNVARPDATFLSCVDNTTDSDHIGIQMNVHEAYIYGQAGSLELSYSEEDIIEFEFNISKNTEAVPMVMGYEDGVSTRPMVYDESYNFTQNTPQIISIGSPDCDLHIYRMKVYNTSMTDRGILNNFIADARNAEAMVSRYNRNQIYDENQALDPDVLAQKCPWLRVYKVSAPYFTNNKSDKVPGTTIQQIYKDGDPVLDNWTCYDCQHSGQGTSSNNYGAAGRNLDFIMNKSGVDGVEPYFIMGDGSRAEKITMTRKSVPVAYLNAKVNIASSNNMTNAMLANRYNEFNPYNRPFVRDEGVDTSFIKDTMEFANCVIFIRETNEDLSTHREFADTSYHFYAIGNIGDSKKSDKTRMTDMNDKYECCVEIMDVELPLSDFPADTMMNAMGYTVDETTEEKTYTWAKNENLGILYEKIDGEYVLTEDTEIDLDKVYYVDILEHDDFSEDFTYGWRYLYEGDDDEENARIASACKRAWIEFYRFVTLSTEEEFKANFENYMVLDSALYYYLFTNRYCMVDNRAKNTFLHFGKTGVYRPVLKPVAELLPIYCELVDGKYVSTSDIAVDNSKTYYSQHAFDLSWDYDNDTACGLNNYGKQAYRYGLEDIDVDEKGEEVFRESDSTFFCRIRDCFKNELKAMYNTLESKNAWHAESFINKADAWQDQFPEELWRVDIERKYIRTYNESFINGKGDSQFLTNMANGKMKYHRRQWERSQEKYMASKYQSSVASSDNAVFRCTVPSGDLAVQPNYRIKLTPYAYMYLNVKYGTQSPIQLRAEPNVTYEIPFEGEKTDILDVYSASIIQDFGDLSTCYVATADTSKAEKVKRLIFGNDAEGYDNPSFTALTTGANYLLETLNIENVSGLTQSLNLSALHNLRQLYAHGSNIGGVTFADGGKLEIAELPAINAMSIKNLLYLTTLDIADFSKLTTLTAENCATVDLLQILDRAPNINRVRLVGVDWDLENTDILEELYVMKGLDKNGYNSEHSVLSGIVHIPAMGQLQMQEYQTRWPDLVIDCERTITQYKVTFVNDDGTILDVQNIDVGQSAVDPITRAENPIPVPTKESSASHDFTYAGWDSGLDNVIGDRTVKATYTSELRTFTVRYVSNKVELQKSTAKYGEYVPYEGAIPTSTDMEITLVYKLFKGWDKSGFVDGDKTINAEFAEYDHTVNPNFFYETELKDMEPVQIYAMTRLAESGYITLGYNEEPEDGDPAPALDTADTFMLNIGNDYDYEDVLSDTLIDEPVAFTGKNSIVTEVKLFDEDKDFVLAIDYEIASDCAANGILAQCYDGNNSVGFKVWKRSDNATLTWGSTANHTMAASDQRDMLVIRHVKGSPDLHIYRANLAGDAIDVTTVTQSRDIICDCVLMFGANVDASGFVENGAVGTINWCKVWYADLGESVCERMAMWPHESIEMSVCRFRNYYLADGSGKRCSFSLLANSQICTTRAWGANNKIGWNNSPIHALINDRLYNAFPEQVRALVKQVNVPYLNGTSTTDAEKLNLASYVTIPAYNQVDAPGVVDTSVYANEDTEITYMSSNTARQKTSVDGKIKTYALRTPNLANTYVYSVGSTGAVNAYTPAANKLGILILISF